MNSVTIDNHVCLPFDSDREFIFEQLAMHKEAGFSAVGVNIGYGDMSWASHIDFARRLTDWVRQRSNDFFLVQSAKDLLERTDVQRLGIFFDIEGASLLEGDPSRVVLLADLGVKWMCLTYNKSNDLAGGCMPGAVDDGLTDLGRDVVEKMNSEGIVVCASHTGRRSVEDIIQHSTKPCIFSHSNAASVYPHWRNIDRSLINMCAEKGGVICVNGVGPFVGAGDVSLAGFFSHLDYLLKLVGPSHIGLGLDYVYDTEDLEHAVLARPDLFADVLVDGQKFTFLPPTVLSQIIVHLERRGLSQYEISCICGGNLVRVFSEVWI